MAIFEVEPVPGPVRALPFDGTNLDEVRDFLAGQQPPGRVTILNGQIYPFLRRTDRPDEPLLPGNTILMDGDGFVHHASAPVMERHYRPVP
jgi:hypothetical protein